MGRGWPGWSRAECGSITVRGLMSGDREEMGKWLGAHGGPLVPEASAQAPGKLRSESGDHRPVSLGPPQGLWLPRGTRDPGEQAGPWSPPLPQPPAQLLQWGAL